MSLTPLIALHLSVALAAVVIGPFAFWARLGRTVRPRWHRALGYAWFSCMAVTVLSALFIRSHDLPNIAGYTPLHLLVPATAFLLYRGLSAVMRGDIALHRRTMLRVYIGACLVAGAFTLLPSRYLGQLIWGQWPGWL
ncbi:DUF2306 domain-containing protein [Herbaspirillum huttiense]|uniref:DUF2306 domain-containing protein n=1 Tax=Herbaspirillum huttiense TaxID=863372 RepID=UPI002176B750|nr:DUF2306 domain-containing protein [Herbaspirillum huttiense]UWE18869.1 DUF2306 domain-containing protein [Herbaspirillum huttiense]